jgi:hypothetical protein
MQQYQDSVTHNNGTPVAGASIRVLTATGAQATIYSDNGVTIADNPIKAGANGQFAFYAADGNYTLVISAIGHVTRTQTGIVLDSSGSSASIPPAAALDGTETANIKQAGGVVQTTLTKIAQWVIQTYQGFTQSGTGAIVRSVIAKLNELPATPQDYSASTGAADNSVQLANTIAANSTVRIPDGTYNMTNFAQSLTKPLRLRGDSKATTTLVQTSSATNSILSNTNVNGTRITDLTLQTPNSQLATTGHPISLIDVNDVTIRDVNITGLSGSGSAIIVYPNNNATVNDIRIEDVNVTGNLTNATNNNGPLIVNGAYSMMRGIHADSLNEFAVEYKNATVHSLASDIIVSNSYNGLTYGNTSTPGTQYSAASNVVSYNCGAGVEYGIGSYNVLSNLMVHNTQKWPSNNLADGVRFEAGSNYNSVSNALFAGTFNQPVHTWGTGNYLSGSFQNTGFGVTLEAGATQNVVAVNHPGTRPNISSSFVLDQSGQPLSGANSNPVYCHATGEYLGTLSGRWKWRHALSGSAIPYTEHKWIYECVGSGETLVLSDGTGQNGYMVSANGNVRGLLYTWSSDFWRLSCGSNGYRFYSNNLSTDADGTASLGGSGARWTNVFSRNVELTPPASVTPSALGSMSFQLTSDTQLTIKVKGSDGVVRSASLTLA